jgi:hypothetical protein
MGFILCTLLLLCVLGAPKPSWASWGSKLQEEGRKNGDRLVLTVGGKDYDFGLWEDDLGVRQGCKHSRFSAIEKTIEYIDKNGDDRVSKSEMWDAYNRDIPAWERAIGTWIAKDENPDAVMAKCDVDHDGYMTMTDMMYWTRACNGMTQAQLDDGHHTCLCNCKAINGIHSFIFDHEEGN